jgi:hypothetical protein
MATSTVGYSTNGSFDYPNGQPANQSCNNNFGNPFCFVPQELTGADKLRAKEDYFKNTTLLTATMPERDFEDLVNLTTELYLETLRSDPTNRCNIDMVKLWVLSGCKTWERLARGKDIPAVSLGSGAGNTVNIKDFLAEFPKDMSGQVKTLITESPLSIEFFVP